VQMRTHTAEPVPYCIADFPFEDMSGSPKVKYGETAAKRTGIFVPEGCRLIEKLFA
jgi:2,3-bisphosphoglycerate-independent phosphoglycerate mutase